MILACLRITGFLNVVMQNTFIKKYIILFVKLSITIVMFWYLFHSGFLTKESILTLFKLKTFPFVILAGLTFIVSLILSATRLMILLKMIDFHLRFFQSFKLTLIGFFFNLVLPGVVGGDFVKGFYLIKCEKHSKGRSTGIVLVDRMLGVFALMVIGFISIIYFWRQYSFRLNAYYHKLFVLVVVVIGFIISLFVAFLVFGNSNTIRKKLKVFFTVIFRKSIFYNIIDSVGILAKYPQTLLCSFILSLLIHLSTLIGLLILGNMVDASLPNSFTLMAIFSLILLFGIIPVTPGNVGWTELLASHSLLAVGSGAGAEIFLYWRIITALCSLPGGLLYLLTSKNKDQMLKTQRVSVDLKLPLFKTTK
jgi:uncharacterized protein (TIRG00374 family)